MKQIETRITIDAKPNDVWNALTRFENYGNWNPFIESITGVPRKGNILEIRIKQDEKKTMNFEPLVLKANKDSELRWKGKLFVDGLFDGEHYFILNKINDAQTEFIHGEKFTGLLSGVLYKMIGKQTEEGFIAMNNALKSKIEN